jgi:hypothetical protein
VSDTQARLDAIRERLNVAQVTLDDSEFRAPVGAIWYGEDIPFLLAELERVTAALSELLDVAERMRGGDPSLDPEQWYATRDFARVTLAGGARADQERVYTPEELAMVAAVWSGENDDLTIAELRAGRAAQENQ